MAETTAPKQLEPYTFKPGQSGNPAGRPKGARHKLGEAFLEALHDDFNEHGVQAIQQARLESPIQYVKVIAGLLPSEATLNINTQSEMSDDELVERIRELSAIVGPLLAGAGAADGGTEATASAEQPARLH